MACMLLSTASVLGVSGRTKVRLAADGWEMTPREEASNMKDAEGHSIMGLQWEGLWQGGPEWIVKVQAVQTWHARPQTWTVSSLRQAKGHTDGHRFESRK